MSGTEEPECTEASPEKPPEGEEIRRSGRKRKQSMIAIEAGRNSKKKSSSPDKMLTPAALGTPPTTPGDPFKRTDTIPRTPTGKPETKKQGQHAVDNKKQGQHDKTTRKTDEGTSGSDTLEEDRGAAGTVPSSRTPSNHDQRDAAMLASMQQMMRELQESMSRSIEESVSNATKKTNEQVKKLRDSVETRLSTTEKSVTDLRRSQAASEKRMEDIAKEVKATSDQLPALVRGIIEKEVKRAGPQERERSPSAGRRPRPLGRTNNNFEDRAAEEYWKSRSSLHLYPVLSEDKDQGVRDFLTIELEMTEDEIVDLEYEIKSLPNRPAPAPQHEVVVTFSSVEQRDRVKKLSKKLAGKEAGIRIDVPFRLRKSHRLLQTLAHQLKQKKPLMKRNIRFNDGAMDLAMDFTIDGNTWRTVDPVEAEAATRGRTTRSDSVSTEELSTLLDGDG